MNGWDGWMSCDAMLGEGEGEGEGGMSQTAGFPRPSEARRRGRRTEAGFRAAAHKVPGPSRGDLP